MTQEMRMMEFAFRMGQSSSQTAASSSATVATQPLMLAIQDDPARCRGHAQDPWVWLTSAFGVQVLDHLLDIYIYYIYMYKYQRQLGLGLEDFFILLIYFDQTNDKLKYYACGPQYLHLTAVCSRLGSSQKNIYMCLWVCGRRTQLQVRLLSLKKRKGTSSPFLRLMPPWLSRRLRSQKRPLRNLWRLCLSLAALVWPRLCRSGTLGLLRWIVERSLKQKRKGSRRPSHL